MQLYNIRIRLLSSSAIAGAVEVVTAVFARKPSPSARDIEPDDFAWDAPARFLIGYGMDVGGRYRDLPFVAAAD